MVPTGTDDLIDSAWLWPYGEKRAIRGREERDGAGLLEEERVRVEIIGKDRWSKVIIRWHQHVVAKSHTGVDMARGCFKKPSTDGQR
uniref:Uncharacterized protein n=1 Tax=Oryza sativa subsp. japonica TaxID=39947 RepID=Q6ZK01_ORYSJ|nr:hypothetical protein [Oryza sativa Japonica Group]